MRQRVQCWVLCRSMSGGKNQSALTHHGFVVFCSFNARRVCCCYCRCVVVAVSKQWAPSCLQCRNRNAAARMPSCWTCTVIAQAYAIVCKQHDLAKWSIATRSSVGASVAKRQQSTRLNCCQRFVFDVLACVYRLTRHTFVRKGVDISSLEVPIVGIAFEGVRQVIAIAVCLCSCFTPKIHSAWPCLQATLSQSM